MEDREPDSLALALSQSQSLSQSQALALSQSQSPTVTMIRYGDIIQMYAETNPTLHEKTFLVDYLDSDKIRLVSTSTPAGESPTTVVLRLDPETSTFVDRSVERIVLVTRADQLGVARQLGLVPGQWVEIRFRDEQAEPLVGKVTHLEEDQIEFTTLPDGDILYIDFGYRGIPEDLPVREFALIPAPDHAPEIVLTEGDVQVEGEAEGLTPSSSSTASLEYSAENEMIIQVPEDKTQIRYDVDPREALHDLYLDANEIQFGETAVHEETVRVQEKMYSLETQLHDFMDELLSTVPTAQRSPAVLEGVHRLLERFKELREENSQKDLYGNIRGYLTHGPQHKPLVAPLRALARAVPWILPVVHARRKLQGTVSEEPVPDVELLDTTGEIATELADLVNNYFKVRLPGDMNKYNYMIQESARLQNPLSNIPMALRSESDVVILSDRQPVETEMEAILDHFEVDQIHGFYATTYRETDLGRDGIEEGTQVRRFAAQRFVTGTSVMERCPDRRRNFARAVITPNDPMTVHSWLMMPYPVVQHSRVRLPQTTMLDRAALAHRPWLLFRALSATAKRRVIDTLVIDDFETNLYPTITSVTVSEPSSFLNHIQRVVLNPDLEHDPDRMEQTLQTMIPATLDLIQLVQSRLPLHCGVSMHDLLAHLEPFLVYASDLTYPQYQRMRQVVKQRMDAYQQRMTTRKQQYETLRQFLVKTSAGNPALPPVVQTIIENAPLYDIFTDGYPIPRGSDLPSSEVFLAMQVLDGGALFANLIRTMLVSLLIPPAMLSAATAALAVTDIPDESDTPISDCSRKFIAKRYATLADLQKDNCADVYFDQELDETPYALLDAYKAQAPKKDATEAERRDFVDLLSVNLVQKHACPPSQAHALATDLIAGKKRVRAGEYAILALSDAPVFYRRMESASATAATAAATTSNVACPPTGALEIWVKDDQVTEESFVAPSVLVRSAFPSRPNAALCNLQETCIKNPTTRTCDTVADARAALDKTATAALQEFEKRLQLSLQETEAALDLERQQLVHQLAMNASLEHMQLYRANVLAHTLGKFAAPTTGLVSPHVDLCRAILAETDFVQRQHNVVRFVEESGKLRTPMAEQMAESPYWFYCTDTNTPLLPAFLYGLAQAFSRGGGEAYQIKLAEITRTQGALSDDGDAWVDRHSGYMIMRIEMVKEDDYDEFGFKVRSDAVLLSEGGERGEGGEGGTEEPVLDPVDDEITALVRVVYRAYADVLSLQRDDLRERVMRLSVEVVRDTLKTPAGFAQENEKKKATPNAMKDLYKKYRNQYVIIVVSCLLLMCIQTAVPALPTPKTVPGCVRSFAGYPLVEAGDDMRSIDYMACILNHIKSASIAPWNAIQGIKREKIQGLMRTMVQTILDRRHDLQDAYSILRSTLRSSRGSPGSDDDDIPDDLALVRWRGFLPPLVSYTLPTIVPPAKTLLDELARGDAHSLHPNLLVVKSKIIQYAYGIIHCIHRTVRARDALLKTTLGIPFVQNACCDDDTRRNIITLDYFLKDTPVLATHLQNIRLLERVVDRARVVPSTMIHVVPLDRTARPISISISANPEENIYHAFIHHCMFDRPDVEIPEDLREVCPSKPKTEAYARAESLAEKIEVLKTMGRKYTPLDLESLMKAVNGRRRVEIHVGAPIQPTVTSLLVEFVSAMQDRVNAVIEPALCERLIDVLAGYDPLVLHCAAGGDTQYMERVNRLKNYLHKANGIMTQDILQFLRRYGGDKRETERLRKGMNAMSEPEADSETDSLYETTQTIQNSIRFMTQILPDQVLYQTIQTRAPVPKHWGLSEDHQTRLMEFDDRYKRPFQSVDPALHDLLRSVPASLADLTLLMNLLPVQLPLQKGGQTWFRWLDTQTTRWLFQYLWLSVYYQYVKESDDRPMEVAALLRGFLQTDLENHVQFHQDYAMVMKKVNRAKDREKDGIMNTFRDADKDTRATMFLEKKWKLGRWNVNLDGLVKYNKTQFDAELLDMLMEVDEDVPIGGAGEVAFEDGEDGALEARMHEENDFRGLGEDYADGDYYGEDDADEFGEE